MSRAVSLCCNNPNGIFYYTPVGKETWQLARYRVPGYINLNADGKERIASIHPLYPHPWRSDRWNQAARDETVYGQLSTVFPVKIR